PWGFPLGSSPLFGMELASSIFFTDSLPFFAMSLKVISGWLPSHFQYFGIWVLVCFLLQAWFGWKLAGLLIENRWVRLASLPLFLFFPTFLGRVHGHLPLAGHWVVLASLYLVLRKERG